MADAHAEHGHGDSHPVHEELGGYEGSKLGMWLFLAQELLFFGVMFCAFGVLHVKYPEAFKLAHNTLNPWQGGFNTLVLILSSLTVVLALDAIQRGKKKRANWMFVFTILLACTFMVVKYFEYTSKFGHGIYPWGAANILDPKTGAEMAVPGHLQYGVNLFFAMYFLMTGVHGLHVVIGIGIFAVILYKNHRGRYSHWYYTPVENAALYWHLVDLIWIYLFPLYYLIK